MEQILLQRFINVVFSIKTYKETFCFCNFYFRRMIQLLFAKVAVAERGKAKQNA